jgi:hypothetical protein
MALASVEYFWRHLLSKCGNKIDKFRFEFHDFKFDDITSNAVLRCKSLFLLVLTTNLPTNVKEWELTLGAPPGNLGICWYCCDSLSTTALSF